MGKWIKRLALIFVLLFLLQLPGILRDKKTLGEELIRLHVVASSDSVMDQAAKLQVRDAVVAYVEEAMSYVMTVEEAKAWLRENLPEIQERANAVLEQLGLPYKAVASLKQEPFPMRHYDTFSLPAGVYESLRITLGSGDGKNWWCVVFPSLCLPAAGEDAESVAAGSGFSDSLTNTVTHRQGYRIRFYFLEVLGRVENLLFGK